MRLSAIALALCVTCCLAESEVLFETDFNQLPDGWTNDDGCVFGSFGAALCVSVVDSTLSAEFTSEGEPPVYYVVPDGADSVVIEIDHWVLLSADPVLDGKASSTALIQLWTSQFGWGEYIFYETLSTGFYTEELISVYTLSEIEPDTWLGFLFRAELVSENQGEYAEVIWQINGMTVTVYGDELSIDTGTWASIKNTLGQM